MMRRRRPRPTDHAVIASTTAISTATTTTTTTTTTTEAPVSSSSPLSLLVGGGAAAAIAFGRNYFYPLTVDGTSSSCSSSPPHFHHDHSPPYDDHPVTNSTYDDNNDDDDDNQDDQDVDEFPDDPHWLPLPWPQPASSTTTAVPPRSATCSSQSTILVSPIDGTIHQCGTMHGRTYQHWTRLIVPLPLKCVQVSAGRHYCLARLEGGLAVMSWGAGHFGQLGVVMASNKTSYPNGTAKAKPRLRATKEQSNGSCVDDDDDDDDDARSSRPSVKCISFTAQPVLIERLLPSVTGSPIQSIAAGDWHALALTESGHVWSWGSNRSLQCGIPLSHPRGTESSTSTPSSSPSSSNHMGSIALPLPIPGLPPMKQIAAGRAHSVALTAGSGKVYGWGSSHTGQCGTGTTLRRSIKGILPTPVQGLPSSLEMIQIDAAGNHCISLSKAGRVFTWGDGREGQLGFSIATSTSKCISLQDMYSNKPRLVADLDFVAVAASHAFHSDQKHHHTMTVSETNRNSPVVSAAQLLARTPKITSVYTSESGSAAISSSGHAYCWGSNDVGQLGIRTPSHIPHEVSTDSSSPDHPNTSRPSPAPTNNESHPAPTRPLHIQTFDSNHNVILPIRLAALDRFFIRSLAMGPNHMFCFGAERNEKEKRMIIGETLHEAQSNYHQKLLQVSQQTNANPYGNGILHRPIATGILECSELADKDGFQLHDDSMNESVSNGAPCESNCTVDKVDLSSTNDNAETTDATNLTPDTKSTAVASSTSSSPVTFTSTDPVDTTSPESRVIISNATTTNASSALTNATAIHSTTVTTTCTTSKELPQLPQRDNHGSAFTSDTATVEKRGRVVRRRFSFGLFGRRSSTLPEKTRARSRHSNQRVNTKDDNNNEPSTGTV